MKTTVYYLSKQSTGKVAGHLAGPGLVPRVATDAAAATVLRTRVTMLLWRIKIIVPKITTRSTDVPSLCGK